MMQIVVVAAVTTTTTTTVAAAATRMIPVKDLRVNCIGHCYIGHNYTGHNYIGLPVKELRAGEQRKPSLVPGVWHWRHRPGYECTTMERMDDERWRRRRMDDDDGGGE